MMRTTRPTSAVCAAIAAAAIATGSWARRQGSLPPSHCGGAPPVSSLPAPNGQGQTLDLGAALATGLFRGANRSVAAVEGAPAFVHVSEADGPGVAWIAGTDFSDGTIDVDACGRDVTQRSFVGLAFHRRDDSTFEVVYVRPFNFRSADPASHRHAVQYMAEPDDDWPRLRQEFPDKYESAVAPSVVPTDWIPLRVVINAGAVDVYVGAAATPALHVQEFGSRPRGLIGLWVGNNSDGVFANLRVTPAVAR